MYKTIAVTASVLIALTSCAMTEPAPDIIPVAQTSVIAETDPCPEPVPEPAQSTLELSGTIRWVNSTTWVVLDNSGHTPTGFASVQVLPDRVRVHYDFTAVKVSSLQATADEAFASANVRVGASVGYTYTDIFFYMPSYGSTPVPPKLLSKAGANVWITGWFWLE